MTVGELEQLLGSIPWVPHVHKEGSREHVFIYGSLEVAGRFTIVDWCSWPFCECNRATVERLVREGFNPADAQPPPRLRALIAMEKVDDPSRA